MKIIFAGTPEFAAVALNALLGAGHRIELVLTQPDRPAGRGLKLEPSAVKRLALERGLALAQPVTLKDEAIAARLRALEADAMVVAAYGLLLPKTILAIPRLGCLNIHASLLPRWRGAAPIQRALLAGDKETGITIMQMNEGLDTGDVLLRQGTAITDDDTTGSLHDRLAALGGGLIVRVLANTFEREPQDNAVATYAAKIEKSAARILWTDSAQHIHRQIRAFNPHPGAATQFTGVNIKLWRASIRERAEAAPGTVTDVTTETITIACGEGALEIHELQRAGGKRLAAAAFLAGNPIARGARFGV